MAESYDVIVIGGGPGGYHAAIRAAQLGVTVKGATLDWKALAERRAKVSETLSGGVKMLWDKNKVAVIEGEGSLTADGNVAVGGKTYEAKAVILATGSVALPIPGVEFGGRIVDTWGA